MKRSESIAEIAKALCKFQAEVRNPSNNATNPMYKSKYATLDNVINTVREPLTKNGLSYIQSPITSDDGLHIGTQTLLMHESGEWIEMDPILLPAYKLGKDSAKIYDAQAAGIATTYSRRYSLSSALGISSEDDDDANGIVHTSGSNPSSNVKPISQKQVGLIKTRALEFGNLRQKTDKEVFQALNIQDVTKLSSMQASDLIKKLDGWIQSAKEEQKGA